MIAWKLLQAGGVGLFSGFAWPLPTAAGSYGAWVEAEPPLRPTFHGIHAIRSEDVLDWLDEEIWEIELDGEIIEGDPLLVASRGRLRRQAVGWDAAAARELARTCVEVVRATADRLEAELGPQDAATLAVGAVYADCLSLVTGGRPEASPLGPGDACPTTAASIASNVAYVAAATAGPAERARQHAWLLDRMRF